MGPIVDNTLQTGSSNIATDDIGGVHYQRVKNTFGGDGVATDVSTTDPFPTRVYPLARTLVSYYTEAYSVTAAEALATITGVVRGNAAPVTTQLTVTAGKTLRVQSVTITGVVLGVTVAATHVRLRANFAGAATATSPIYVSARLGNPAIGTQAANYGLAPVFMNFPDGFDFPAGTGLQFTAISSTAAMHSLSITLLGYEA